MINFFPVYCYLEGKGSGVEMTLKDMLDITQPFQQRGKDRSSIREYLQKGDDALKDAWK